jgi:hypothetical protein
MKLAARTTGRTAYQACKQDARFGVHSIFDSGLNLLDEEGYVVFVTTRPECAPWAVNVPGFNPRAIGTDRIRVNANLLEFGEEVAIDLGAARLWHPARAISLASPDVIQTALDCAALPTFPSGLRGCGVSESELRALCEELYCTGGSPARKAPPQLLGLGQGLTPAGDDFLVGLIGTLTLTGGGEIMLDPDGRTTKISEMQLRHAQRGELSQPLHALIVRLARGNARVSSLIHTLLNFGNTSGLDLLAGVRAGFEIVLGTKKESNGRQPILRGPLQARHRDDPSPAAARQRGV